MSSDAPSEQLLVGRAAFADAVGTLVAGARMELAIQTYDFDPRIFGSEVLAEQVKTFCLTHERTRVRVLVNQPQLAMRSAHRFVELGRRLSSRIQFRQLDEQDRGVVEELVIADARSLLRRERSDQLEARLAPDAPLAARLHLKSFDELWERAVPAREFTALGL